MKSLFDIEADTSWGELAACKGSDPRIFDGVPTGYNRPFDFSAARQKCSECIVTRQCLEDAIAVASAANLERGTRFWVFQAGMTPRQLQEEYDARGLNEAAA